MPLQRWRQSNKSSIISCITLDNPEFCRINKYYFDNGDRPAVLSAIMKQQTTERARIVLNEAMDIHAGASICFRIQQFFGKILPMRLSELRLKGPTH